MLIDVTEPSLNHRVGEERKGRGAADKHLSGP